MIFLHPTLWLKVLLVLDLTIQCSAIVIVEKSCDPYKARVQQAVSEAGSLAGKAAKRLRAANDWRAAGTYMAFFGANRGPEEVIGQFLPPGIHC